MLPDNIIDMAARRAGLPPPVIDLWELATTGATADRRLSLGMDLAEVLRLLGVRREDVELQDAGIPGHHYWQLPNNFVLNFEPGDRLDGLYYDANVDQTDLVSPLVKEAVAGRNYLGDAVERVDLRLTDTLPVRLKGFALGAFATLPRFLGVMHGMNEWEIATRGNEKWLGFRHITEHGRFTADFVLNAFQTPYVEAFQIDYCLLGIGHLKTFQMNAESNVLSSSD